MGRQQLHHHGGTLFVCLDNLGDLVFCSSLVQTYLSQHAETPLALWVKDYSAPIASLFPGEPVVYSCDVIWDKSPSGRGRGNIWKFLRTLMQLRQRRFATAVICTRNWRASLCAWLLGIPTRIGFDSPKARKYLTQAVSAPPGVHVTEALGALLPSIAPSPAPPPKLRAPTVQPNLFKPLPEKFVVLHAFAGNPRRCLAIDVWQKLAEHFRASGTAVIWFGSEFDFAGLPATFTDKHNLLSAYTDAGSKLGSLAVLNNAHAFVGHDSGPLHIAAALGLPVLGLYLPSEWQRTRVRGPREDLCQTIHRQSPAKLSVEELTAAVDQLLSQIHLRQ